MESKKSFERYMEELETIVEKLETGKIPLDEMVTLYERGASLGKTCMGMLDAFEGKLDILGEDGEHDI